jgi:chromosome segregation ATPase
MRSDESFAAAVARLCHPLAYSLVLCLVLASPTAGQQQAQAKKRVPKLTTDDVARSKQTTVEVVDEAEAGSATAETKAEEGSKPSAAKTSATDAKVDPEEASWRERVEKARERAKAAQRDAEEAELLITQLRNQLGASGGTPRDRNETAAQLDQMGPRLRELREEARTAEAELKELLDDGKKKSFAEGAGPKPTVENGEPNDEYYKTKHTQATQAIQDADRKMQLYESRIRELNERLNSPSVDRFSASQLQQDREEAQQKLEEAREARAKAQTELDELKEEARRAGVSPGVFR